MYHPTGRMNCDIAMIIAECDGFRASVLKFGSTSQANRTHGKRDSCFRSYLSSHVFHLLTNLYQMRVGPAAAHVIGARNPGRDRECNVGILGGESRTRRGAAGYASRALEVHSLHRYGVDDPHYADRPKSHERRYHRNVAEQ